MGLEVLRMNSSVKSIEVARLLWEDKRAQLILVGRIDYNRPSNKNPLDPAVV